MCSGGAPKPPKVPPPPPDFSDQQVALAIDVQKQKQQQIFAGLSSSIVTGAAGVINPSRTTKNPGAR